MIHEDDYINPEAADKAPATIPKADLRRLLQSQENETLVDMLFQLCNEYEDIHFRVVKEYNDFDYEYQLTFAQVRMQRAIERYCISAYREIEREPDIDVIYEYDIIEGYMEVLGTVQTYVERGELLNALRLSFVIVDELCREKTEAIHSSMYFDDIKDFLFYEIEDRLKEVFTKIRTLLGRPWTGDQVKVASKLIDEQRRKTPKKWDLPLFLLQAEIALNDAAIKRPLEHGGVESQAKYDDLRLLTVEAALFEQNIHVNKNRPINDDSIELQKLLFDLYLILYGPALAYDHAHYLSHNIPLSLRYIDRVMNVDKDYENVVSLCLKSEAVVDKYHHSHFHMYRLEAYRLLDQMDRYRDLALIMLLRNNLEGYHLLKGSYSTDEWETYSPSFLERINKASIYAPVYLEVLTQEDKKGMILSFLEDNPRDLVANIDRVLPEYRDEAAKLLGQYTMMQAGSHASRSSYAYLATYLDKLAQITSAKHALTIYNQLLLEYPRRPAMRDELSQASFFKELKK